MTSADVDVDGALLALALASAVVQVELSGCINCTAYFRTEGGVREGREGGIVSPLDLYLCILLHISVMYF